MAGGPVFLTGRTPERICRSKPRYRSRARARAVAKLIRSAGKSRFYVYHCPICDGYHLTERDPRGA